MRDFAERTRLLRGFADRLEAEEKTLTDLLVRDLELTLKSIRAREVVAACAHFRDFTVDYPFEHDPGFDMATREPLGKVGVMLPYNGIGLSCAQSMGAAYFAGNEVLLRLPSRAASFTPFYRKLIESSLPDVTVVETTGREFLGGCLADPSIHAMLVFGDDGWIGAPLPGPTGSTERRRSRTYRDVVRQSHTKFIFEGPGKDPFIVFDDANLERAADGAVRGGYANSGQSCSSPERFYVHESVADAFVELVAERTRRLVIGPPVAEDTDIGPIGSPTVVERLKRQFVDAKQRGATFIAGGEFVQLDGCKNPTCLPTIVTGCSHDMLLLQEETFGPVIPVVTFKTEDEAIALAEDSRYGLTATVYGGSPHALEILRESHGNVFHDSCVVDPENMRARMYWGGFRNSSWIWEWVGRNFVHREGLRYLVKEFSKPADLPAPLRTPR